jgi:hypothetical protein
MNKARTLWGLLLLVTVAGAGEMRPLCTRPAADERHRAQVGDELQGTVAGEPWMARSAVAFSMPVEAPERYVMVFPFEWTCADVLELRDDGSSAHFVSFFAPWVEGALVSPVDGSFDEQRPARSGELRMLRVPRANHQAVRVRLSMAGPDPEFDRIEGEIEIEDCGPP